MSVTAKSVVFDIANNYGESNNMGLRGIEFYLNDSQLALTASDFTAYSTTQYSASYVATFVFDTTVSRIGTHTNQSWVSTATTSQRVIVVFNSPQTFNEIQVSNFHLSGGVTNIGSKDVKVTSSTDDITDTTYNASIANSTLLKDDTWLQHAASNIEDWQVVFVSTFSIVVQATLEQVYNLQDLLRSVLTQPYHLTDSVQAYVQQVYGLKLGSTLQQLYSITDVVQAYIQQVYGLKLGATLQQPYGNAPVIKALLNQYYSHSSQIQKILDQRYGNALQIQNSLEQSWNYPGALQSILEQRYAITATELQAISEQIYDMHSRDLVSNSVDQIYGIMADALVQKVTVSATIGGRAVDPHHITEENDRGQYDLSCELHLRRLSEYIACKDGEEILITVDGETSIYFVESRRKARSNRADTNYIITGLSPTARLDAPYSLPLLKTFEAAKAARIVADLAAPLGITVNWNIVDWFIPADTLFANNETPYQIIYKIKEAAGATLQSEPDGSLTVEPAYPVSIPTWKTVTPDLHLSDAQHFFDADEQSDKRNGFNQFYISDQFASTGSLQPEEFQISDTEKQIRCYQVPWDDQANVDLTTSGGDWVSIEPMGIRAEIKTETVEFVSGSANTSRPIFDLLSLNWLQTQLGAVTFSENGKLSAEIKGESLLQITYQTKYHLWLARDAKIEQVQFVVEAVE